MGYGYVGNRFFPNAAVLRRAECMNDSYLIDGRAVRVKRDAVVGTQDGYEKTIYFVNLVYAIPVFSYIDARTHFSIGIV